MPKMPSPALWLAGLAIGLAGCASLPTLVPDLARRARRRCNWTARAACCRWRKAQAVLERLASRGSPTDIFERHLALEEAVAGSRLTVGNEVRLLQDGPATTAP